MSVDADEHEQGHQVDSVEHDMRDHADAYVAGAHSDVGERQDREDPRRHQPG